MNRKESKKKWRQANAERLRIYQRNYRATHREEGRKYMQKYRARRKEMMVGEGDIIQQAMEASQTFDPLDDFVFYNESPSNVIDAIDFGFSQGMSVSSTDPIMSKTLAQEVVSNRSGPLLGSSTSLIPETFDWFDDIIDNSTNHRVLTSEIKSCPAIESSIADMKAELTLLKDSNFFLD